MSSEFEIEIVFDDGGFDIRKAGLLGEFFKFVVSERIEIARWAGMEGDGKMLFIDAEFIELGSI